MDYPSLVGMPWCRAEIWRFFLELQSRASLLIRRREPSIHLISALDDCLCSLRCNTTSHFSCHVSRVYHWWRQNGRKKRIPCFSSLLSLIHCCDDRVLSAEDFFSGLRIELYMNEGSNWIGHSTGLVVVLSSKEILSCREIARRNLMKCECARGASFSLRSTLFIIDISSVTSRSEDMCPLNISVVAFHPQLSSMFDHFLE